MPKTQIDIPKMVQAFAAAETDLTSLLAEREGIYGSFDEVAETAQDLKLVLKARDLKTLSPSMLEALDMICNKMARVVNGDPYYIDSWHDIAGYAQLVVDELREDLFSHGNTS
jgi:hypothetical protein